MLCCNACNVRKMEETYQQCCIIHNFCFHYPYLLKRYTSDALRLQGYYILEVDFMDSLSTEQNRMFSYDNMIIWRNLALDEKSSPLFIFILFEIIHPPCNNTTPTLHIYRIFIHAFMFVPKQIRYDNPEYIE